MTASPPPVVRFALLLAFLAGPAAPAAAQVRPGEQLQPGEQLEPGTITDDFVSPYDGRSRHAVYVPSTYTPDRGWPLVLVMDARGRALVPLERMVPAAERWGYILVSSYDTASDGPSEPNITAVEAMLEDAQNLLSIDTRRLYFVGFSGTARQAWTFGRQLAQYTAGVIGFGAGLPSPTFLLTLQMDGGPPPFAFFGGAGRVDFNYDEVRHLDERLDGAGIRHRIRAYDGPHAWPPEEVFRDALEWMEILAVQSGTAERSPAAVDTLYRLGLARADSLAVDDLLAAADAYQALIEGFDGVRSTAEARAARARISESDDYRRRKEERTELAEERAAFDERFAAFLDDVRGDADPFDVDDAADRLGVPERLRLEGEDSEEGRLSRRILEAIYVRASFYEPASLLESGAWGKAEAFYRLAERIRPDRPRVCLGLARVHAQTGATEAAVQELRCAVTSPALGAEELLADELLAPLRTQESFQALLRELRGGRGPQPPTAAAKLEPRNQGQTKNARTPFQKVSFRYPRTKSHPPNQSMPPKLCCSILILSPDSLISPLLSSGAPQRGSTG